MGVNNLETELDLLNLIIKFDYKTIEEFVAFIGMSRQHLNRLKRKAEANNGVLDYDLKLKLKGLGIDLYKWKQSPKKDHVNTFKKNTVAEEQGIYINKETLVELLQSQQRTIESQQATISTLVKPAHKKTA
jgi:hypothetical protein